MTHDWIRKGPLVAALLLVSTGVDAQSGDGIVLAVEGGVDLTTYAPAPVVEVRYEPGSSDRAVATFGVGSTFGLPGPDPICNPDSECAPADRSTPLLTFFFEPEVRYGGTESPLRSSLGGRLSLVRGWGGGGAGIGLVTSVGWALSEQWVARTRLVVDYLAIRTEPREWRTLRIGLRMGFAGGV